MMQEAAPVQRAPVPDGSVSKVWGRVFSGAVCSLGDGGPEGTAGRRPMQVFGVFGHFSSFLGCELVADPTSHIKIR